MKGKLYLSGGGSEDQTYDADRIIFENVNKVLYIPLAWAKDPTYESCRSWFEGMIEKCQVSDYYMLKDSSEDVDFGQFDMVYVGGGNTFKLLKELKESGLGMKIVNYFNAGGIVYGGSAGAIVFGNMINTAVIGNDSDENNVGLKDFTGLKLVDYDIHCHYEEKDDDIMRKYCNENNVSVVAISEEAVVEVIEGKISRRLGCGIVKVFEK